MHARKINPAPLIEIPPITRDQMSILSKRGKIITRNGRRFTTNGNIAIQAMFLAQNEDIYPLYGNVTAKEIQDLQDGNTPVTIRLHTGYIYTDSLGLAQQAVGHLN